MMNRTVISALAVAAVAGALVASGAGGRQAG